MAGFYWGNPLVTLMERSEDAAAFFALQTTSCSSPP